MKVQQTEKSTRAERTHLGLKLQVRHSKPPLDQPSQTDSDAAATTLRMCPCSYMAQIQVLFLSLVTTAMHKHRKHGRANKEMHHQSSLKTPRPSME